MEEISTNRAQIVRFAGADELLASCTAEWDISHHFDYSLEKAGFRTENGIQKIGGKAYLKKGLKNPCKSNCSCVKIKSDKIR
ncbi:MAG: hypothetical protein ACYS32_14505 [Planctomycetota bacterium]|jgi:hypothetical protein